MKIIEIAKRNKLLIIVAIIYGFLFVFSPEKAIKSVNSSMYYLIEMFEVLPLIFLLTVVIEASVPKEVIMNKFGDKSGFVGNLLSLLLGSISAGPIYAAIPICKMLISKGASIRNITIILSSWAVIKIPMLANEAKFLGVDFMIRRWVLTVISIFIMAYIVGAFVKKEDIPTDYSEEAMPEGLSINESYCMGCGLCARLMPDCFEMKGKKAIVNQEGGTAEFGDLVRPIMEKCPVKAITFKGGSYYGDNTRSQNH